MALRWLKLAFHYQFNISSFCIWIQTMVQCQRKQMNRYWKSDKCLPARQVAALPSLQSLLPLMSQSLLHFLAILVPTEFKLTRIHFWLADLYDLSYTWYCAIGAFLVIIFSLIYTCLISAQVKYFLDAHVFANRSCWLLLDAKKAFAKIKMKDAEL